MKLRKGTEKAITSFIEELKEISLYEDTMKNDIAIFYQFPDHDPPIEIEKQFKGQAVKFRVNANFGKDGLYLQNYSVYVPDSYPRKVHFVHNGIDSALLEERMKLVDWNSGNPWAKDGEINPQADDVKQLLKDIGKFAHLGWENDFRALDRASQVSNFLLTEYLGDTQMKQHLLAVEPHLEIIFYREIRFPPYLHSGVPGNRINNIAELERLSGLAKSENFKNKEIMNLNNLEQLKENMHELGFSSKLIQQMEENMQKDIPEFKLHETSAATRGYVDLTLHFKQSGQSDFYYFKKFEAVHHKGKALEEGQKYMVISPNPEQEGKNIVKKLENVTEAIEFFKEQKGKCELAVGKDAAHKSMVASMEDGKVNYVSKEFKGTFYNKPIGQTFWIDRGKGFNAAQAVNLVQGRAIYRDDLMNMSGEPYKAWLVLDVDKGKDRYGNFSLNQFNDPSYGFKLNEVLEKFKIKELDDPKKAEKLQQSLMNGNRPLITVEKDGQPHKLFIEAVPRFRSMNMFEENGAPAKREQYMKEANLSQSQFKGKEKENEMAAGQGMAM